MTAVILNALPEVLAWVVVASVLIPTIIILWGAAIGVLRAIFS